MSDEKQRPVDTLRDGQISASIWKHQSEKDNTYYTTTYAKNYRDENGEYQTSHSFYGTDHLKLAELSKKAYQREKELYQKDREAEKGSKTRTRENNDRER